MGGGLRKSCFVRRHRVRRGPASDESAARLGSGAGAGRALARRHAPVRASSRDGGASALQTATTGGRAEGARRTAGAAVCTRIASSSVTERSVRCVVRRPADSAGTAIGPTLAPTPGPAQRCPTRRTGQSDDARFGRSARGPVVPAAWRPACRTSQNRTAARNQTSRPTCRSAPRRQQARERRRSARPSRAATARVVPTSSAVTTPIAQ